MTTSLLPVLVACTGTTTGDSGTEPVDSADTGTVVAPWFFDPVVFVIEETWAATDGTDLTDFSLADGTLRPASLTLTFLTEAWFTAGDPAEQCTWVGTPTVTGLDDRGDDSIWTGFELSVALDETDCADWDRDTWTDGVPTTALESAAWWTGYGPLEELQNLVRVQYQDHGLEWNDWLPHVFAQSFELTLDDQATVVKTGPVLAYGLDDGVLDEDTLLTTDVALPLGVLHGTALFAFELEKLPR